MIDLSLYNTQMVAIIELTDLQPSDPANDNPDYLVNVLAKHPATNRVEVLVLAKNPGGIAQFRADFPNAGEVIGDGTPDDHDDWTMLAFSREVQNSTSPVEVFMRSREKDRIAEHLKRVAHERSNHS